MAFGKNRYVEIMIKKYRNIDLDTKNVTQFILCYIFLYTLCIGCKQNNFILFLKKIFISTIFRNSSS